MLSSTKNRMNDRGESSELSPEETVEKPLGHFREPARGVTKELEPPLPL